MELSEIRTEIYERLGEPTDGTGFVDDTILDDFINEAQFDINMRARAVWTSASSQNLYENWPSIYLPANVLTIKRVQWNEEGDETELKWRSWAWLDDTQEGWEGDSAEEAEYFFMYDTNREIYLDVASNADTTLLLDFIKIPTTLSSDTDTPETGDDMDDAIIMYTEASCLMLELDSQKVQDGMSKMLEYIDKVTKFKRPALHRKRGRQSRLGG